VVLGHVGVEGDVLPFPPCFRASHRGGQDGRRHGGTDHRRDRGAKADVGGGGGVHDDALEQRQIRAFRQAGRTGVRTRNIGHGDGQFDVRFGFG
jgi:hypothetical protein